MKNYILIITVLFYGCKNGENENTKTINDTIIEQYEFITYNYCTSNLLFDEHILGNTIISITPNNNFLKCTAVGNTEFMFSCGRGRKEIVLLRLECGAYNELGFDGLSLPKLEYDDEEIIILYYKGGSDSWMNYFVHLSENKVYFAQALYIDYENRKYIYLNSQDYMNNKVSFIVHNIMSDRYDTINSNYYKYRKDGYPSLNIIDVSMKYDTLFYSINRDDKLIRDTIIVNN